MVLVFISFLPIMSLFFWAGMGLEFLSGLPFEGSNLHRSPRPLV
jgi:hypothetical protein